MRGRLKKNLRLGKIYENFYSFLCGKHPRYYPWHFQWHAIHALHKWQKKTMKNITGHVLDVGCGNKPYAKWFSQDLIASYIGIDITKHDGVDYVVKPDEAWALADKSFDYVLMLQSLEHTEEINQTLKEVHRVLKNGGVFYITVPFLYPQHGAPYDFRRFTAYGLKNLLKKQYDVIETKTQGKLGSVLAMLFLTGIENTLNHNFLTRLLKGLLVPFWILISFVTNMVFCLLNVIDLDHSFYCHVCVLAKKRIS